ncbi:ERVV2 protein, partial [Herpetotheres cachinnans]|nr:ERVV2 protein [Herpetotheres cachinnans]
LASHGGVCTVINSSCCVYVSEKGRIEKDLKVTKKRSVILQGIEKDDTSWGFTDILDKLTSWLPNFAWLKQLFVAAIGIIVLCVVLSIMICCSLWCCTTTKDSYAEWKRNQLRRKLESDEYFMQE